MEQTDHDILIELKQDLCWLKKLVENHLKHHWMITVAAISAAIGAFGTLIIFLVTT